MQSRARRVWGIAFVGLHEYGGEGESEEAVGELQQEKKE